MVIIAGAALLPVNLPANTFTVTATTDTGAGSGTSGDFRYCLTQANADTTTPRVINFAIPGGGVQTINPANVLPTVTKFTTIDATTQSGYAGTPLVVINGNSGDFDGLVINAFFTGNINNKTFVKGLCIINCGTNGGTARNGLLLLDGDSVNVSACYIGINAAGTAAARNTGAGIRCELAITTIGGTTAADRCVISGNLGAGIDGQNSASQANQGSPVTVLGSYIGVAANGMTAVPNGGDGVRRGPSTSSATMTIGNSTAAGANVISGNSGNGVHLQKFGNVFNNIIGLAADGATPLGNTLNGVLIDGTSGRVGDAVSSARNIISANGGTGVRVAGTTTSNDFIFNNYIGTDVTGMLPRGNAAGGVDIVSGALAVRTNVVSGNTGDGIRVASGDGIITSNIVGGSANGAAFAIPNTSHGIEVVNTATGNIATNTVVGNGGDGIRITGASAQNIVIKGNKVGTNVSGTKLGNNGSGISITGGAQKEVIGSATATGINVNVIAFNKGSSTGEALGLATNTNLLGNSFQQNNGAAIGSPFGPGPTITNANLAPQGDPPIQHVTGTLQFSGVNSGDLVRFNVFLSGGVSGNGTADGWAPQGSADATASPSGVAQTAFDFSVVGSPLNSFPTTGWYASANVQVNPAQSTTVKSIIGPPSVIGAVLPGLSSIANVSFLGPIWPPEPVNANTGELFSAERADLSLGGPMPLGFSRYYASLIQRDGRITGRMGDNWLHNFEMKLVQNAGAIEVVTNAGRSINFNNVSGNWVLTGRADIPFQLVASGPNFILGDPISQRLFTFDSTGKLIQIADGHGNAHTLSYTGSDLTSVSDGLGRALTFTYSGGKLSGVSDGTRSVSFGYAGNNLTSFTDALTFVTTYSYDTGNPISGLMTAKTEPEGNQPEVQTYATSGQVTSQTERTTDTTGLFYGPNHQTTTTDPQTQTMVQSAATTGELSGMTDEANKTLTVGSDATGRRNFVTDRLGDTVSMSYHAPSGKPASITNADGKTTSFSYVSRNVSGITFYDLSGISYPDGTSESFGYTNGNMTSHTDRAGKAWSYTNNANGQMLTATNPTSGVITLTYNANGTLASSKDSDTGTTTYTHDAFSRPTRLTHPDTTFVQIGYDANDRVTGITDERTNSYGYTYDHNGNLKVVTDPLTHTTQFGYDALDRVLNVTDRLNHVASRTFNSRDDVATITDRNNNTTSLGYDTRRRRTSIADPANQTWSFGYDDEAVLASFTNPLNQSTSTPTDKLGILKAITDPLNHTMSMNRDSMKRVTSMVDPIGRVSSWGYDARGLLTGAGRTGLSTASYRRNNLGLVDRVTDLNGQNWIYDYTGPGRLSNTTDPLNRSSSFIYDTRGRLSQLTFANGGTLVPTFDASDNLTRLLYSGGPDLQYSYDALNRLTNANNVILSYDFEGRITNTTSSGVNFGAGYDNGGRLASVTYNNSAFTVTYSYDTRSRLIGVTDSLTSTNIGFNYDDAGRLTGMSRSNNVNGTYTYDAAGRLARIQEGSIVDLQYALDAAGQITSVGMTVPLDPTSFVGNSASNYTYDAAAQLSTSGYSYDARGRSSASPGHTFIFDGASRLTQIDATALTFNGFNDILTRTVSGTTIHYFYNNAIRMTPIAAEKNDTTSQFVRYYVWTPGGRLLYSIDASSNAVSFYHCDRIGSTLALTNSAGAVTDSYAYGPYGEALGHTGSSNQPFTYGGEFGVRSEPTASLYHVRARFYDATTARFLTRDPQRARLRDARALDPYLYALGNPTLYLDRNGAEPAKTGSKDGVSESDKTDLAFAHLFLSTFFFNEFKAAYFLQGDRSAPIETAVKAPDLLAAESLAEVTENGVIVSPRDYWQGHTGQTYEEAVALLGSPGMPAPPENTNKPGTSGPTQYPDPYVAFKVTQAWGTGRASDSRALSHINAAGVNGTKPASPTGLFTIFDGQTLRRGEFTFSIAYSNFDRDPGNVDFTEVPISLNLGLSDHLELFFKTSAFTSRPKPKSLLASRPGPFPTENEIWAGMFRVQRNLGP